MRCDVSVKIKQISGLKIPILWSFPNVFFLFEGDNRCMH